MPSLNLADYAKLAADNKDNLKLGVVQAFRQSPILDMLSYADTGDLKVTFTRAKSFPTPAFRKIGAAYSSSKGDFRPGEDRIYPLGQNIDVDKTLVRMKTGVNDPRAMHRELALEAMRRTFHYYFINGDPTTDEDGMTGLFYRLQKATDRLTSQSIDGSSIDLDGAIDAAIASTLINKIEELVDACNEGDCDALLMDRTTKLRLEAAFRISGLLSTTEDQLGRKFSTYGQGGPKLIAMGYHRDETDTSAGTKVIGQAEATDGSALTGGGRTSIYAVKFGKDALGGAQEYAMEVTDKGELDDGVTYRDVIDWPVGIYIVKPRSIARLYGIDVVA